MRSGLSLVQKFLVWICSLFASLKMSTTHSELPAELLDEYVQLTYLSRAEIITIFKKFCALERGEIEANPFKRFSREQICAHFTALKYNPLTDRIFRVFSDDAEGNLNFEEFLNLCSVFSLHCPPKVKATWAFLIYDFDEDNQITRADIVELLERLTRPKELLALENQHITDLLFEEVDIQQSGVITQVDFLHAMTKIPELANVFSFKP